MITATVTEIRYSKIDGVSFAFARSRELETIGNPDGLATFTIVQQIWKGSHPPRVGDVVVLDAIRKVTRPEWRTPRWRAYFARPLRRAVASNPTSHSRLASRPSGQVSWLKRLLGVVVAAR